MNSQPLKIEHISRLKLSSPERRTIMEKLEWDDSQVSRFLSGNQEVTISKIAALVAAVSYVLVTRRYLDAISTLSEVGVHCECARQGSGECGRCKYPLK